MGSSSKDDMMPCPQCGKMVPVTCRFCQYCGYEMLDKTAIHK